MALEYQNEYPDIMSRPNGGMVSSARPLVQGTTLTERDGKSNFVCGGVFSQGQAAASLEDCNRV
ncbi:hypothetical protein [uncultured Paracoccus sp.]|uniref:hypothetical protein n=1 Tax=uncultured Paracoccus sp. TaxID=189685 RepID=UPI0025EF5628|nr:hypothetical protein [uncultured Paracoccus sp.]